MATLIHSRKPKTAIVIKSRKPKFVEQSIKKGVSRLEYDIIKFLIDYMGIDIDDDYTILDNYIPVKLKKRYISFPHFYMSIKFLERDQEMFRPLKHETHANFIIEMFIKSYDNPVDCFEYEESEVSGFNGWLVSNGKKIHDSMVFNMPTVSLVKTVCIARTLMTKEDYKFFMSKIMYFISESSGDDGGYNA